MRLLFQSKSILDNLFAIEDVYMIGYPNGLWDEAHNLPIARKGMTATNPVIDYNGKKEFLVDMAVFPGSSGSPVFLYNPNWFTTKKDIQVGGRIYLLGVLYASPLFEVEGEIVVDNELEANDQRTYSDIPMNLGYVIRIEKVVDFKPLLLELHKKLL